MDFNEICIKNCSLFFSTFQVTYSQTRINQEKSEQEFKDKYEILLNCIYFSAKFLEERLTWKIFYLPTTRNEYRNERVRGYSRVRESVIRMCIIKELAGVLKPRDASRYMRVSSTRVGTLHNHLWRRRKEQRNRS